MLPTPSNLPTGLMPERLIAIYDWLDRASAPNLADEILSLSGFLQTLRKSGVSEQQLTLLGRLHARALSIAQKVRDQLLAQYPPVPYETRLLARHTQSILRQLSEHFLDILAVEHSAKTPLLPQQERALTKSLAALYQHLLISYLGASSPEKDTWHPLHQIYELVERLRLAGRLSASSARSLNTAYHAAILLGISQATSFTPQEFDFVVTYIERCANKLTERVAPTPDEQGIFWVDARQDTPAIARSRKKPLVSESRVRYFCTAQLTQQLQKQQIALADGIAPSALYLSDFFATSAGAGVLRKLFSYWNEPGKRRFPRRRKTARGHLYSGLETLWHLPKNLPQDMLSDKQESHWMILNESPDGCELMHIEGEMKPLSVGGIVALRMESENHWRTGLIRRIVSENQEHLELGLSLIAQQAIPAFLAQKDGLPLRVLLLPKLDTPQSSEQLVVPASFLSHFSERLILIVEQENTQFCEIKNTGLIEQNSQVAIFSFERIS